MADPLANERWTTRRIVGAAAATAVLATFVPAVVTAWLGWVAGIAAAIALGSAGVAGVAWWARRVQREAATSRITNEDLSKWVASAVEQVRELSERIVQIHEAERGRMARDLHDSLGQAIAAVQMDLELLRSEPFDSGLIINRALAACADAMQELRGVVYDLRPPELSESAEVSDVLRAYVERFEIRSGVPTSFRAAGRRLESEEVATCLLRVLQEALNNIRRHAFAREVGVVLKIDPDEVVLQVHDDGQGFDPTAPATGRGLRGIHERCAFLGGRVSVDSGPERGTRLEVHLPLGGHA